MDKASFVTIAVAVLGSSGLAAIINWIRDHRKDETSNEAASVATLREVIRALSEENERLRMLLRKRGK